MKQKIIISGAGLVGSLWAVFMAKRGYEVDVYERRPDMRKLTGDGGRSINLAMSTRGWKALEKAGIKDEVMKEALAMKGRMMHSTSGELTFQPYGKEGEAIYSVSRAGLNRKLMDIAESHDNVKLHFDMSCKGINTKNSEVSFKNNNTGEVSTPDADFIFGADGVFSAIRSSMQRTDRFNYSQYYLPHGYKELTIPATADGDFAMDKDSLHIWPRGEFMMIALPNPNKSFTCTLFLPYEGEESFNNLKTDDEIMAFFNSYFGDAVPMMPTLLEDFKGNPTPSLVTIRCNPWQMNEKILLIGDASHGIVPFYGQGMNSGFEDCTVLDEMADAHNEDWKATLKEFSNTRVADANAIADLAMRNFVEMRDLVGDPMFLLRKKIAAWLNEEYPKDFLPLYSMVTFSHIPYNEALEEGKAQDRLFEKILALPNIEKDWKNGNVLSIFKQWLVNKK
jgi:kynurenine 3-monooxygenase